MKQLINERICALFRSNWQHTLTYWSVFFSLDYVSLFWVRPFWTWDVRLSPRYRRSLWSSSPNSFSSLLEAPLEDSSVKREYFEEIYCSLYFSSLFFGGWHVMSNFLISMTCLNFILKYLNVKYPSFISPSLIIRPMLHMQLSWSYIIVI